MMPEDFDAEDESMMKIEHSAWTVEDPVAAADWYVEHLGMQIVRANDAPAYAHFLADATGRILLEIYNNPKVQCPDYRNTDPLIIHLAFAVDDVPAERDRLLAAGATVADEVTTTDAGDEMCMLRDPWGFPIQILKRAEPM
jgi:glyoxylase I family protein